jgi:beta-lactamase regulating signal transducer with metallopeptidase domain
LRDVIRWLVVAWLAGVVVLSLRLLGGWHRLGSVRTQASPAATIWQARLAGIAERLGIHTAVRLLESFQIDAPCAIGWLKPVVLVPSAMLCEMAPAQLEAILAHELAHIWRNDYLVNLLQSVIEAVLFYHPAVWWISSRIRAERENCCDDLAIRMCGSRTDYARALMSLEDLRVSQMHLVPAATGSPLLARVRRIIVQAPTRRRASCWPAGLFVLATAVALSVAVACRPHNPSVVPTTTTTSTTPSSQPANSITGRVVDSEGKPVYQAVILLTPQQGNASSPLQRPRATDRDGRFHFDVVAGNYLLRAFSSDHRATRNATVAGPGQNVTIILEKNVSPVITGRVVDANGAPLRTPPRTGGFGGSRNPPPQTAPAWIGARVAIGIESVPGSGNYAVISRRPGELHSFTDDAGHFAIDAGFPDLRCCLIIEADGYVPVKTPLDGPYGIGQSRQLADIVLSKRGN